MITPFDFAATPHIHFGTGRRLVLPDLLAEYGSRVLLVTGGQSFDASSLCQELERMLRQSFEMRRVRVSGEPTPELVDEAVQTYRAWGVDCVLSIGGGSAIDAGKAIAGLLPSGDSVMEYLEGVGAGKAFHGPTTPFIAVPTTAGTGGETSKNAVLSRIGAQGFKKSFRHESLVARHIVLDPELTLSCPPEVSAACGMDALTQLIESYVSSKANPMSDALALGAIGRVRKSLLRVVEHGDDLAARADMLYASSISGLTLANAGLGSVHGLASPLGAFFPIPHGVACGTLLAEAVATNIRALSQRAPEHRALTRYAQLGRLLTGDERLNDDEARAALCAVLEEWAQRLRMPPLGAYGVGRADVARIVAHSRGNSMKTNPIELTDQEIGALVIRRL
ncbi:MAG: iron-containing alcohol dehydrogenase [Zetaproteobacteria bacterium]|nr:MAG: iron-containing alcohol dehydrogenase [Zetaproteobacteria bacterium]